MRTTAAIIAAACAPLAAAQDSTTGELDPDSPTADRPNESFSVPSSTCGGSAPSSYNDGVPYQTFLFYTPASSEQMDVKVTSLEASPLDFDPVAAIHCRPFDPNTPDANLVEVDDDGAGYPNAQLTNTTAFNGQDYVLVVYAYSDYQGANFGKFVVDLGGTLRFVCLPDVNRDGTLDPTDFGAWLTAYNNNDIRADQNLDGQVTPTDFGAWLAGFNAGCP